MFYLSHFNILEDEEVRQGIKEYSNWPTFPQLYINGDLVGGLDVMKELHENNELVEMFESADSMKTKLKWLTNKAPVCHHKTQRGLQEVIFWEQSRKPRKKIFIPKVTSE